MGINGLWKTLSGIAEHIVLKRVSSVHKMDSGCKLRIGVDMSTVMAECTAAGSKWSTDDTSLGAALAVLFNKLAVFLRSPAYLVFVYDGELRPNVKHGSTIDTVNVAPWTIPSQKLLSCFGFHYYQAPGEAEAELAELNKRGKIDCVVTSDSDVFVFGGRTIYRTLPNSEKIFDDDFVLYSTSAVEEELELSRGGLVLFALLCGGDYDPVGIKGCGSGLARGLARAGFGDWLICLLEECSDPDGRESGLNRWRLSLIRELETNESGFLDRRAPLVAGRITQAFPDLVVADMYLHPITSWSVDGLDSNVDVTTWSSAVPSLVDLANFCAQNLGWKSENRLKTKFRSLLLEGIFLQMVYSPVVRFDDINMVLITPSGSAKVIDVRLKKRRGKYASTVAGGSRYQARIAVSEESVVSWGTLSGRKFEVYCVWVEVGLLPGGMLPYRRIV